MKAGEIVGIIKGYVDEVKIVNDRRIFAATDEKRCREAMLALKGYDIQHLSTISGVDHGDAITVVYHIDCKPAVLSLKLVVPKGSPKVRTITDIFPGAILYERDLMEMLGVKVEGHPDPRKLFLPDDWPADEFPLRKGWKGAKG